MNESNDTAPQINFEAQHRQYLADCHSRYTKSIELLPPRLTSLGVAIVTATYSGCGDSGQIDEVEYLSSSQVTITSQIPKDLQEEVETFLYDALESRHGGWENNDGGEGEFRWTLVTGDCEHTHRDLYIESASSYHDGFGDLVGCDAGVS